MEKQNLHLNGTSVKVLAFLWQEAAIAKKEDRQPLPLSCYVLSKLVKKDAKIIRLACNFLVKSDLAVSVSEKNKTKYLIKNEKFSQLENGNEAIIFLPLFTGPKMQMGSGAGLIRVSPVTFNPDELKRMFS